MRQALILSLLAAAALFTLQARAAEQTRSVAPFTAVSNTGPISVHIEVGKAQSVIASGDDDGDPKIVNTSGGGLGSISRGK
jgi:hypothetical protein